MGFGVGVVTGSLLLYPALGQRQPGQRPVRGQDDDGAVSAGNRVAAGNEAAPWTVGRVQCDNAQMACDGGGLLTLSSSSDNLLSVCFSGEQLGYLTQFTLGSWAVRVTSTDRTAVLNLFPV